MSSPISVLAFEEVQKNLGLLEKAVVVIHKKTAQSWSALESEDVTGISQEAVLEFLKSRGVPRAPFFKHVFILGDDDFLENYVNRFPEQSQMLAALHHAVLKANLMQDEEVPSFTDPFEDKYTWFMKKGGASAGQNLGSVLDITELALQNPEEAAKRRSAAVEPHSNNDASTVSTASSVDISEDSTEPPTPSSPKPETPTPPVTQPPQVLPTSAPVQPPTTPLGVPSPLGPPTPAPVQPQVPTALPKPAPQKGGQILHIYWTRHAYSCANLLKDLGHPMSRGSLAANASLSDLGIQQGLQWGPAILEKTGRTTFDLVGASALLRAQQTAALIYKPDTIHVLPYISEKRSRFAFGMNKDNEPDSIRDNKAKFEVFRGRVGNDAQLSYTFGEAGQSLGFKEGTQVKPDLGLIVDHVLQQLSAEKRAAQELHVAIVAHQHLLKALGVTKERVPNCAVVKGTYAVQEGKIVETLGYEQLFPEASQTLAVSLGEDNAATKITFYENGKLRKDVGEQVRTWIERSSTREEKAKRLEAVAGTCLSMLEDPKNFQFFIMAFTRKGRSSDRSPERTPEENLERRRISYKRYAAFKKAQKNSYGPNENNDLTNNNMNAWMVNTNTNEWQIESGDNINEKVPRNLQYIKNAQIAPRKHGVRNLTRRVVAKMPGFIRRAANRTRRSNNKYIYHNVNLEPIKPIFVTNSSVVRSTLPDEKSLSVNDSVEQPVLFPSAPTKLQRNRANLAAKRLASMRSTLPQGGPMNIRQLQQNRAASVTRRNARKPTLLQQAPQKPGFFTRRNPKIMQVPSVESQNASVFSATNPMLQQPKTEQNVKSKLRDINDNIQQRIKAIEENPRLSETQKTERVALQKKRYQYAMEAVGNLKNKTKLPEAILANLEQKNAVFRVGEVSQALSRPFGH